MFPTTVGACPIQTIDRQVFPRVIYGPPDQLMDVVLSYHCEFIISNLPEDFNEDVFLTLLQRFGIVYQFQLMVDSAKMNRDYAFVRYTIELDAQAAMELLNRYFLRNGEQLKACKVLSKRSLYVTNIPKELPYQYLYAGFLEVFPKMTKLLLHSSSLVDNRGFAFIEFDCHQDAVEAKRNCPPSGIYMWGTRLTVLWADKQPTVLGKSKNTFLVRGILTEDTKLQIMKLIQNFVSPTEYQEIQMSHNQGFITFQDSAVASRIFRAIKSMRARNFVVEWAKNSFKTNVTKRTMDYCAELRMICIANEWQIPVILFGKNYRKNNIQYCSILLANKENMFSAVLMEVTTMNVYDIQATMCELVVQLINKIRGFPLQSFVYRVTNRSGHLVCTLASLSELDEKRTDRIRDWQSIQEMAEALGVISTYSEEAVLSIYKDSFLPTAPDTCIFSNCLAVYPKYRNKPPLSFNLNDTEIVLVLRDNTRDENLPPNKYFTELDDNTIRLSWKKKAEESAFVYIDAGRSDFYHPAQRFNVPPIWIPGRTYTSSVKNFIL